jgi:hypothetical protein
MPLKSSKFHDARRIGVPTILAIATAQVSQCPQGIRLARVRRHSNHCHHRPPHQRADDRRPLSIRRSPAGNSRARHQQCRVVAHTPGLNYSSDFGRAGERRLFAAFDQHPASPQPVSIFIDGLYIAMAHYRSLDDAQRVEVIKAPIALYGAPPIWAPSTVTARQDLPALFPGRGRGGERRPPA